MSFVDSPVKAGTMPGSHTALHSPSSPAPHTMSTLSKHRCLNETMNTCTKRDPTSSVEAWTGQRLEPGDQEGNVTTGRDGKSLMLVSNSRGREGGMDARAVQKVEAAGFGD